MTHSPERLAPLKFYTDTHIAKAVALQLRERGVDVVRCEEVGLAVANDLEHLEFAMRENRMMITNDDDFLAIKPGESRANDMRGSCTVYRMFKALPLLVE